MVEVVDASSVTTVRPVGRVVMLVLKAVVAVGDVDGRLDFQNLQK